MRPFLPALLILVVPPLMPAGEPGGRVLEPVVCQADPTQRYVLYVPSGYSNDRRWPAIFCFDASARGRMPVERLQAAAERYGYIIAGSLNSRNGPWAANAAAAEAMMKDVSAHFSLDPRRIYATGVSGGARVATALALSGMVRGVIACAAGFPAPEKIPAKVAFAFFGTTGTEDFNHGEMVRLDEELEARHTPHRLVVFPGGHEWASAALMTEAVEWLELEAMRAGTRPKSEEFIQQTLRSRRAQLPAEPGPERWRALKALVADFEGLVDVSEFRQAAKELEGTREVQAGLKAERALTAREAELLERLGDITHEGANERRKLAADLHQQAGAPEDSAGRQMRRRVIASFCSMTNESVRGLFEAEDYDRAEALLETATVLRPEQPRAWFDLARARAWRGARREALAALQRAVASGFNNATRLESEPAFAKLRAEPGFQEILTHALAGAPTLAPAVAATAPAVAASEVLELPVMKISAALAHVEVSPFYLPNARADLASAGPRGLSHLRVETVRVGSAADRAGLKPSMEITSIQGFRLHGLSDDELNALMARPAGHELVLVVRDSLTNRERELHISLP